jgi:mRNA interferase RelE/StbE
MLIADRRLTRPCASLHNPVDFVPFVAIIAAAAAAVPAGVTTQALNRRFHCAKWHSKAKKARQFCRISLRRIVLFRSDPNGHKKLAGLDHYRVRQGNYRILYSIDDQILLVVVVAVGHRRDIDR